MMFFNTREAAERQARDAKLARDHAFQASINQVNQETDEMGSKHCPLVGKNCILGSCVHFFPGCVVGDEDTIKMIRLPGCKLWK